MWGLISSILPPRWRWQHCCKRGTPGRPLHRLQGHSTTATVSGWTRWRLRTPGHYTHLSSRPVVISFASISSISCWKYGFHSSRQHPSSSPAWTTVPSSQPHIPWTPWHIWHSALFPLTFSILPCSSPSPRLRYHPTASPSSFVEQCSNPITSGRWSSFQIWTSVWQPWPKNHSRWEFSLIT